MTIYRIPNQGKLTHPNNGDVFGNVKSSLNQDWRTNPGRIRLSPRLTVITKDNDGGISNFGLPVGFETVVISSTEVNIAICGSGTDAATGTGKAFVNAAIGFGAFTAVGSSPTTIHHQYSDMVSWTSYGADFATFKRVFISTMGTGSPNIAQFDGAAWDTAWFGTTRSGSTGTSDLVNYSPIHLCPAFNGNLYVGQQFMLAYVPSTGNAVKPSSTTGANANTGTIHTLGKYTINWVRSTSNEIWAGLVETSSGRSSHQGGFVARWKGTGTAFDQIYKINAPLALSCVIHGDVPYIIDGFGILKKFTGSGFLEVARLPVANLNVEMPGLYDQYSNTKWIHHRGMNVVNEKINILVNNFVSTGVYVTDMPSGIWEFDPSDIEKGIYHKNSPCADSNDYGQQLLEGVGALFPQRITGGNYLAGVSYYTDDTTTNRKAISFDDVSTNTNKKGSFVTPFIASQKLQDHWNNLAYRFRTLPSGDKIIGKYRTGKKANLPFIASITWTSTTTFTSTDANFQYASVGDEVEGMMGKGSSSTAHISVLPAAVGGTYTVTLEEAIGFSSGTAKVKVDNFKKGGVISSQNINQDDFNIPEATNTNIQVKTEMRFTGDGELDDLTITSSTHK